MSGQFWDLALMVPRFQLVRPHRPHIVVFSSVTWLWTFFYYGSAVTAIFCLVLCVAGAGSKMFVWVVISINSGALITRLGCWWGCLFICWWPRVVSQIHSDLIPPGAGIAMFPCTIRFTLHVTEFSVVCLRLPCSSGVISLLVKFLGYSVCLSLVLCLILVDFSGLVRGIMPGFSLWSYYRLYYSMCCITLCYVGP